jgi:hypothetical protein
VTSKSITSACLLSVVLAALAPGANLTIQGVNRAEFWAFKDNWATHAEDKLDLNLRYGDLAGELGLFMYEPSQPWVGVRKPMRLLDYTVAYSPEQLEVLYGKFYQTFGRGLTLRSYSDDDFRHYKSLHGLRGTARLPLSTEVVALAGRLRDVFFQENAYKVVNPADTNHQVLGADLTSRPLDWGGFGARYVRINRDSTRDPTAKAFTELYGGDLEGTVGPVDVYGEVCQRLGTKPGVGGRDKGLGYYLSATAAFTGYSLLGEYMDYDNIGFPSGVYHYNDPPTPIKSGVAMNRGEDEKGFGLTATATPLDPLYLEANYGRLYKHEDTSTGVVEWEGKTRYSLGTDWTFEAKFNHMVQQNVELHVLSRGTDKPTVHVNYLLGQSTFAFEAEYDIVKEERDDTPEEPSMTYHESALSLSYGYGEALLFTAGWQYVDKKLDIRYAGQTSWPMLEVAWSITERNLLRVRIGAERGGYTCSGGVCRFESPFNGVKAQLISRF